MSDEEFEQHLIEIKEIGFNGIMFELSVSVEDDGTLLDLLEYEKLKKDGLLYQKKAQWECLYCPIGPLMERMLFM